MSPLRSLVAGATVLDWTGIRRHPSSEKELRFRDFPIADYCQEQIKNAIETPLGSGAECPNDSAKLSLRFLSPKGSRDKFF